ncbi:MAG: hypothetical protein NTU88_10050, partial [Armatimonadetes bacterium]|nr:hypothetical protein [Armatimonadota bacterium]
FEVPTSTSSLATLTVSWRVKNEGLGDAAGTWFDGFYLSADQNLDEGDVVLAKVSPCGPLAASEEYAKSTDLQIPLSAPGLRYLILKTDADGSVAEGDETDNTVARPLDIVLAKQMIAAPSEIPLTLDPGVPETGEIRLGNLGAAALTGITSTVQDASANITVQISPPTQISPLTITGVSYTVTASDESVLTNSPKVRFTSAEGPEASITFTLNVRPRQPRLEASPPSLVGSMLRGSQSTIECEVANTGGAAASELQVRIPESDWLSLVTPADLGTLEPGDKAKVGLALRPASDLPLGPHSGTVIVSGSNSSVTIPFTFTCVSDQRGDLKVYAEDSMLSCPGSW